MTAHDTKLTRYIAAGREQVEHDTEHALLTQTVVLAMDRFPNSDSILVPLRPLVSVSSITYYDDANTQQTLSTDVYGLDIARRRVYLKYNQTWPGTTVQHDGVEITLVAGYGSDESDVPLWAKQAILLQTAKWWMHRGDESKMPAHDTAYESIIRRRLRTGNP